MNNVSSPWFSRYRVSLKVLVFTLCLLPFLAICVAVFKQSLGPDPAEALSHMTGEWAWRFLLFALLMTPMRLLTLSTEWIRYRRMLGLFAFFYATLHLLSYCALFLAWQWSDLWLELKDRPYITVGFLAWLLLLPLAITSLRAIQRRMGRNWRRLHRLVYVLLALAWVHLAWQSRSDISEAVVYFVVIVVLLLFRLPPLERQLLSRRRVTGSL